MSTEAKKRAEQAKRILDDPLVQECFDLIETNIKDKWESTRFEQNIEREKLYMQLHAFHEFKRFFTSIVKNQSYTEKLDANGTAEH